jgi:hypothetical protein
MKLAITSLALTLSAALGLASCSSSDGATTPRPSTAEILAKAPTLQILLDASGSSPATNQNFIDSSWPDVEERIRAMPIGSMVMLETFGDSREAPYTFKERIQAKASSSGDTMNNVVAKLHQKFVGFPQWVSGMSQGQTHAIGAFNDAAKNINRGSEQNSIIMLSDLIENSSFANCHHRCRLPKKPAFSLQGSDVVVLGAGRGLPSDEAMNLEASWQKYLDASGANKVVLKRVF